MKINFIKYKHSHGGREKYFPVGKKKDLVGDCAIRAIALSLEQDYMKVFKDLMDVAVEKGIPYLNCRNVYAPYLESKGWTKKSLKQGKIWLPMWKHKRFLDLNKNYIFDIKVGFGGHLTSVVKGVNKDTWLCQERKALCLYESP